MGFEKAERRRGQAAAPGLSSSSGWPGARWSRRACRPRGQGGLKPAQSVPTQTLPVCSLDCARVLVRGGEEGMLLTLHC